MTTALVLSEITVGQVPTTKNNKSLSSIDFLRDVDINKSRQASVDHLPSNTTLRSVTYVYGADQLTQPSGSPLSFSIYCHGHAKAGAPRKENCALMGLACSSGNGQNNNCSPGKCIIGRIRKVKPTKWQYTSASIYDGAPITYFFAPAPEVVLKPIVRGKYGGADITSPASLPVRVLLPVEDYFPGEYFLKSFLIDSRSIETRKEEFIRDIVLAAYPNKTDGVLYSSIKNKANPEVRNELIKAFSGLLPEWSERCNAIIAAEDLGGFQLASAVYDKVALLFAQALQTNKSRLGSPAVSYDKDGITRPVYSKLPGIAEAYSSGDETQDKPAKWLVSGVDEFLDGKKAAVDDFYMTYLDPETCRASVLDWLAQHAGFTGPLWNSNWSRLIKETLIRNAFGWVNDDTKALALSKFPFTEPMWDTLSYVGEPDVVPLQDIATDEIGTIFLGNEGDFSMYYNYRKRQSKVPINRFFIDRNSWDGLWPARGSKLAIMFLISTFGLKAHDPSELEIQINSDGKLYKPRTGLREGEFSAMPLFLYSYDVIQVGTTQDAEAYNYTNQLIAGISRVSSVEEARNVFFRVPYYYNRNGQSWDKVKYIADNYMPNNLNVVIQYPYLSADLWSVGDAFFEIDVLED